MKISTVVLVLSIFVILGMTKTVPEVQFSLSGITDAVVVADTSAVDASDAALLPVEREYVVCIAECADMDFLFKWVPSWWKDLRRGICMLFC